MEVDSKGGSGVVGITDGLKDKGNLVKRDLKTFL